MNFGGRTPEPEALRLLDRALERGITLLDTANLYTGGASERIVGKALRGKRDRALVATKAGLDRVGGRPEGLAPAALRASLEGSLRRLRLEHVDLFYLHAPDHQTPPQEIAAALGALLQEGKIRAWGVSNFASWQTLELIHACEQAGTPRPLIAQMLYNPLLRQLDLEYARFRARYRLHTTVYNPLAGGLLSGRYGLDSAVAPGSRFDKNALYQRRYFSPRMLALVEELHTIAREAGLPLVQLSYRWLVGRELVDSVLVGPATEAHLIDALEALQGGLDAGVQARVDEAYARWSGTDASYAR
jgi:aryl-alcohol dehydrogenase-like predicted oxidoreductase